MAKRRLYIDARDDDSRIHYSKIIEIIPHDRNVTYENIVETVEKVCADFVKTPEGGRLTMTTGICAEEDAVYHHISWNDFVNIVPNEFCMKYGFEKGKVITPDATVELFKNIL